MGTRSAPTLTLFRRTGEGTGSRLATIIVRVSEPPPVLEYRQRESPAAAWVELLRAIWFLLWVSTVMTGLSIAIAALLRLWW